MSSFQQQDAQEYYSKILDELDKEILKSLKDAGPVTSCGLSDAHDSVDKDQHGSAQAQKEHPQNSTPKTVSSITRYAELQNPLDGLLAQRVGCIRCGYTEVLSMIPFNCITVPLGRDWIYDVRDCLSDYTKLELIEGVDCAKCSLLRTQKTLTSLVETPERKIPKALRKSVQSRLDAVNEALEDDDFADNTLIKKCQVSKKSWVSSTKSRQAVVARPPNALVIHINRSVFDELTGAQMKNYADVRFPKDLDLGPWCLGSRSGSEEEWSEDPTSSMIADLDEDIASSPFQYTLRAVVTHYGRHENGHYICYRKHQPASNNHETQSNSEKDSSYSERESPPSDQAWWRLSDEDVSKVSEEAVLSQGGVFMLFYERCDSNSVPTSPVSLATAGDAPIAATATPLSLGKDAAEHFEKDHVSLRDAAGVPLPDDDDEGHLDLLLQSPVAPVKLDLALSSYPTPPPEDTTFPRITDEDSSATDTGDPSAHMTSDDDIESGADIPPTHTPANQTLTNHSPALMRTAGTSGGRRNVGSRASLPMVAAT
jgi:ubiquitin carboxyl-terminal hydrolase 1